MHLSDFEIPGESEWIGKSLADLNLGKRFGVQVVSILRGNRRINIPKGSDCLFPGDRIQVIATDAEMEAFAAELQRESLTVDETVAAAGEMELDYLLIGKESSLLGKNVRSSAGTCKNDSSRICA